MFAVRSWMKLFGFAEVSRLWLQRSVADPFVLIWETSQYGLPACVKGRVGRMFTIKRYQSEVKSCVEHLLHFPEKQQKPSFKTMTATADRPQMICHRTSDVTSLGLLILVEP